MSSPYPPRTSNKFDSSFPENDHDPVGTRAYLHEERRPLSNSARITPASNVRRRPRAFRVTLHSTHRTANSTLQAATFNVRLPTEFTQQRGSRIGLLVESFVMASLPNTFSNVEAYPFQIAIREMSAPYNFQTPSAQAGGTLVTTVGRALLTASPRDHTNAVTCMDPTLFDRPVTITLTSPYFDAAAANGISNEWTLTLIVYDDAGQDE